MQFFKLLALAPLCASLVAAAALPSAPYGELIARDEVDHHANPKYIQPIQEAKDSVTTVKAALSANASLGVYADVVNKTYQAVAELDVDFKVQIKQHDGSFVNVLIDLEEIFSVTIDAHEKILNATVDSASFITVDSLDKNTVTKYANVFAGVQSLFQVWLDSDGNFNTDFSVRIDAFVNVLVRYLKVSEQYATGLTAQIQAQIGAFAEIADKAKAKTLPAGTPIPGGRAVQKLLS